MRPIPPQAGCRLEKAPGMQGIPKCALSHGQEPSAQAAGILDKGVLLLWMAFTLRPSLTGFLLCREPPLRALYLCLR